MKTAATILRWLAGLACLIYGVRQLWLGRHIDSLPAVGHMIFGLAALLAAVFLLLSGLIARVCEFLARPLMGVILPDDHAHKPPLSYRLARRYAQQLRHCEAIEEYQKIILYYPDERDAYLELATEARMADDNRTFRKTVTAYERRFGEAFPADFVEIANRSLPPLGPD